MRIVFFVRFYLWSSPDSSYHPVVSNVQESRTDPVEELNYGLDLILSLTFCIFNPTSHSSTSFKILSHYKCFNTLKFE